MDLKFNELIDYTEWERRKWSQMFRQHGKQLLEIPVGPHRDDRFETVGDLVKHIFAAEIRYIERLTGRPLTDASPIPSNDMEALFEFGQRSRSQLKGFLETQPAADWEVPRDFKILQYSVNATPKKIVAHILMHEIRHWAQIGTLLRLSGFVDDFHDFIASPVMGGYWTQGQ